MPADFSGFWARDYARSDNIDEVWLNAQYELARKSGQSGPAGPVVSERDVSRLRPLARLVELITRTDELTISQTEYEILVERRDDFSLMCAFYDGVAKPTESAFGKETCGWDGDRLISVQRIAGRVARNPSAFKRPKIENNCALLPPRHRKHHRCLSRLATTTGASRRFRANSNASRRLA